MSEELIVVGLSHRTAPVAIRERLAITDSAAPAALERLVGAGGVSEALLLSTCNRVEVYATGSDPRAAIESARGLLLSPSGDELDQTRAALYAHRGQEAVSHAFRVASSLDSLVVGEPQILGQVKTAFEVANDAGTVGTLLGRCFTRAFSVAKRVRNETGVAEGTVSVSSVASELARKIFGDLRGRRTLLVGAGDMGEAAARSLASTGAILRVVNRSPERAEKLAAACGGEARDYELLQPELVKADVVICSTSSDRFVLTSDRMREVLRARRHKPLFVIDIAVPRDVDPRVGEMNNVFLYDVDDLQRVADEGLAARRREMNQAEQIVRAEVSDFENWRRSLTLTPTIVALRAQVAELVHKEFTQAQSKLGGDPKVLAHLERSVVNKLLHPVLTELKRGAARPDQAQLIATTRRLFALDDGDGDASKEGEVSSPGLIPTQG